MIPKCRTAEFSGGEIPACNSRRLWRSVCAAVIILLAAAGATFIGKSHSVNRAIVEVLSNGGRVVVQRRAPQVLYRLAGLEVVPGIDRVVKVEGFFRHWHANRESWPRYVEALRTAEDMYLSLEDVGGEWEVLEAVPGLSALRLYSSTEGWSGLSSLWNLRRLYIRGKDFTSADCEQLAQLQCLVALDLFGTAVDDDGLNYVATIGSLEVLSLGETRVSSGGVRHLGSLCRLRVLELQGTAISDAAVSELAQLKSLAWLDVSGTSMSEDGAERLRQLLPECGIRFRVDEGFRRRKDRREEPPVGEQR